MTAPTKPDPCLYHGEIRAADGRKPYNGYLWPSECWTAEHGLSVPGARPIYIDYRLRIEVFAVIIRPDEPVVYSTCGHLSSIQTGFEFGYKDRARTVFATRSEAIRANAARMIRMCRRAVCEARGDKFSAYRMVGIHRAPEIITWARQLVARETGAAEPKPISLYVPPPPAPPPPVRKPTGLPLLDLMEI